MYAVMSPGMQLDGGRWFCNVNTSLRCYLDTGHGYQVCECPKVSDMANLKCMIRGDVDTSTVVCMCSVYAQLFVHPSACTKVRIRV